MAAPGPSSRPPTTSMCHKPSRLPQHLCRTSTDKSSSALPASSSVSQSESSHPSALTDTSNNNGRVVNRSRPAHKSTRGELNRTSMNGRKGTTDNVQHRRLPQPLRYNENGVVSPTSRLGQRSDDRDVKRTVRPVNSPSCGTQMSALRSAGRQQQQQPQPPKTLSIKLSTTSTQLDHDAAAASWHHVTKSPVNSTSQLQRPASRRRTTPSVQFSAVRDYCDATDRLRIRHNSGALQHRQKSAKNRVMSSGDGDEVISPRSDRTDSLSLRHLPSDQHKDNLQGRSDGAYQSTSSVGSPTDSRHERRPVVDVVEPRRRYYHLQWRLSGSEVDDLSTADSVSTIRSSSLSGTLTDDDDESESTTLADKDILPDHGHLDTRTKFASNHAALSSLRDMVNCGDTIHTKPLSHCANHTVSEIPPPPSATSVMISRRPVEHFSKDIQRIGNFGITRRAPVPVGKDITSPLSQPQNCASQRGSGNRPRSRTTQALLTDKLAAGLRSNIPSSSSPRRFLSESATAVTKNVARHVAHSPPSVTVGRDQQMIIADNFSVTDISALNSTHVKSPTSAPQFYAQKQQITAVKKAASAAADSNAKSSVSHLPVSSSSQVVGEKRAACHLPSQRASSTANISAASKISSKLRHSAHQTGNGTGLHAHIVDKDGANISDDRKLFDKPVNSTTEGVIVSQSVLKPITAAAGKIRSPQSEAVRGMDNNIHAAKTARNIPIQSTRSTKIQTPSTVVTHAVDNDRHSGPTTVTARPPQPPSKLKRPSSVCGVTFSADRRRVNVAEQIRPASTDYSAVGFVSQKPASVCRKKSDFCANVADLSKLIEKSSTASKPTNGALNKNDQLTKSYDCISPRSSSSGIQNSDMVCSQKHGSSTSLFEPRRLVKPYSVINRCSTFGRKMTAPKVDCLTDTDCNAKIKTERGSTGSRPSPTFQARSSELSELLEVDELNVDRLESDSGADRLSSNEEYRRRDSGRQESTVERTQTMSSPPVYSGIKEKSTESYKYRTEYSIFLDAVSAQGDNGLTTEASQVVKINDNPSPHPDYVPSTIKQDQNGVENSCSSKTRLPGICKSLSTDEWEDFRLVGYDAEPVSPANKSPISVSRPTEIPIVEQVTAVVEAADSPSPADSYVVTYESDNIVVLDRKPVFDCLTPDGDVVNTEVRQLLTVSADTTSADGGCTLPLSESGYDTWKSSRGCVAVVAAGVGNISTMAPNLSAEQQLENGTLRVDDPFKTFNEHSSKLQSSENNVCETCRTESDDSSALFRDGKNVCGESTDTLCGAAGAIRVNDDDGYVESPSGDDDSGRVNVEDFACRVAQMFVPICSDAAQPVAVAGGASSCSTVCVADNVISQDVRPSLLSSPPDNAVTSLTDRICFSSQTIPCDDSELLPTCRHLSINEAHLEHSDEEVDNASSSMPGTGHFRRRANAEISGLFDSLADDVHDETCLNPTVASPTETVSYFNASENCADDVNYSGQHREISEEVGLQLNSHSVELQYSTAFTAADSESKLLDTYETICDDLLESIEADISDSEASHPSSSTPCVTDMRRQPHGKSTNSSEKLTLMNGHGITDVFAVDSDAVDRQLTVSRVLTLSSTVRPLSTVNAGRIPVTTIRRAKTNFSVVYRQTTLQPTVPELSENSGQFEAMAKPATNDLQSEPVGCRRALAVLASRLDDSGRRRLAETNIEARGHSSAVDNDPAAVAATSLTVSLSSKVRPVDSYSVVNGDVDASLAWNNVDHLQSTQSSLSNVKPVNAVSKLPISTTSATRSSVSKMPSTFRKLISTKLSNAVRRTQAKHN